MSLVTGLGLVAVGAVLIFFSKDMLFARRFGPITDGARSSETGGVAFRFLGVICVLVGVAKLVAPLVGW
ncbi:hypothetical protein [Haloferax sp. DFSO60]|uniref:hypothetical protein n=1 Tax=Haloferax sp. DFSO60 TaxID=3388652 RepID=UPI003979D156